MDHKRLAQTRSRSKLDPATPNGEFHGQRLNQIRSANRIPVAKLTRLRVAESGRHNAQLVGPASVNCDSSTVNDVMTPSSPEGCNNLSCGFSLSFPIAGLSFRQCI